MVVIREAEIVLNPVDRVTIALDRISARLSKLMGERTVPIDLDKKIFKNIDNTQAKLNKLGKSKIGINISENSADVAKNVTNKFDDIQNAFSQPISLTITDQISRHIDSIGKQLDVLRAKAIIPVGLTTGVAAAGLAAGAIGVAAAGLGIAATIPAAADLEASMIRVNKLIGMEGEAAEGVQKDMQNLMMSTGKGLDEIAAAYEQAGSTGIGGALMDTGDMEGARKEISAFVRTVLEASSAFEMSAGATSSMLSGIANVYKPAGNDINEFLRRVGSGIDAVANATKATEEQVMTAMSHASSAIAMFTPTDKTVKGIMSLSAALVSTNMSADTAGEAIRDFYNFAKTDADKKISKSLGMKSEEYQTKLVSDPIAILNAAIAKYNELKPGEQGEYSKMFGMTGAKILQLSSSENFKVGLETAQSKIGTAYDDTEGTQLSDAFIKSMKGARSQTGQLYQTIVVLAQVIGGIFLPGLDAILYAINSLLGPLVKFVQYVIDLASKIPGMNLVATAASILAVATAVRVLASFLLPVIAKLGLVSKVMMVLTMYGNMVVSTLGAVGGTIGAIVGVLGGPITIILALVAVIGILLYKTGYLQKAWDKFRNSAIGKDFLGGIVSGVDWLTGAFDKLFSWLGDQWSGMSKGALGGLMGILDTVAGAFGWLFDKIDAAYASGSLGKTVKIALAGMFPIALLIKPLMMVAGYARQLWDSSNIISDIISAGKRAIDIISSAVQWLYDSVRGAVSDVTGWLSKLWTSITSLPATISSYIKSWFPGVGGGEEANRSRAEMEAGAAIESEVPGAYVEGVNGAKYTPSQWAMAYMFSRGDEFSKKPVYGPGGAATGKTVEDFMTPEDATYIMAKAAAEGGKPVEISGIHVGAETFDEMFRTNMGMYPIQGEALNRLPKEEAPTVWPSSPHEEAVARSEGNIDPNYYKEKYPEVFQSEATTKSTTPRYYVSDSDSSKTLDPAEWGHLYPDQQAHWIPQYAIGATFRQGGLFAGQVHAKEEIIPQAIAQKGPGPISKAVGDLQATGLVNRISNISNPPHDTGATTKEIIPQKEVLRETIAPKLMKDLPSENRRAVNITVGGLKVDVNNPVVPDSGAAYQLTDILKRQLDPFIEETVKRKVAQYIT